MDESSEDFPLPTSGGSLDEYLAEMHHLEMSDTSEIDMELPEVESDEALTVYGAMLESVRAALRRLEGQDLTTRAQGFRAFLRDFLNSLKS